LTSAGCDSFIVLTVTLNPTPTTPISRSICQGQSTTFNGLTITQAGTFRDTLLTSAGCDSFIVLTVTLNPTPTTPLTQEICQGSSIVFNGQTITQAGVYRDTLSTSLGCDSFIVLTISVNNVLTTNQTQAICQGQSIVFNGQTITQAGTFRDTFTTVQGCDSFVVLTVTLNPTPTTPISRSICQGQSTTFNGLTITQAGTFRDTLLTSAGCDSFIVLTVTLNPTPTTPISRSICQGQSTTFNGLTITQAGTFRDTLLTSAGCDSFVVLTVTLNPTPTTPLTQEICQGSSIVFNGQTITQAGVYRDTLSTSLGCDSFIVLTILVNDVLTTNQTQTICQGQSIVFNGQTISLAGTYTDTFTTVQGCDSFVVLTLNVNPTKITNLVRVICQGASVTIGNSVFTTTGNFSVVLNSSVGCDSTVNLNLTVNPVKATLLRDTICEGDSIQVGNQTFYTAGTFVVSLLTSQDCDSIVTLDLFVNPVINVNLPQVICEGDSVIIGNQVFKTGGQYSIFLQTSKGCDSIIKLNLTVLDTSINTFVTTICDGDSITIGDETYKVAGIYTIVLKSTTGCDSTVILDLRIKPTQTTNLTEIICQGESVTVGNLSFSTTGVFTVVLQTFQSCDSTVILDLTVNPISRSTIFEIICEGDSIIVGNQTFNSTGNYTITLENAAGCDSIISLDLVVNPIATTNIVKSICRGEAEIIGNQVFTETGNYTVVLQTSTNCDSTVNLDLTVVEPVITELNFKVCQGETIAVGDSIYSTTGTYSNTLNSAAGCDSIVNLNLIVDPAITTPLTTSICDGDSLTIGNQTFKVEGAYSVVLQSAAGCDSTVNLNLTVNSVTRTSISRSICSGDNFVVGNETFTETGEYTIVLQSALGCDSTVLLNLLVNNLPNIDAVADQPTVNIGEAVQLNVTTSETLTYNWTPADLVSNSEIQNPTAVLNESTWFYVTATNGQTQCRFTDSVFVELNELSCSKENVFIPNAFTPNGDEVNDIFIPRSVILKSMKLLVVDRWGHEVFESNDINIGWDGNYKGQPAQVDSYGYYFIGECSQGEKITIKGNVSLLR
jgi:gliding motility-associated-like protein